MKDPHHYDQMMMTEDNIDEQYNEDNLDEIYAELYEAQEILERLYKKVTPKECASKQDHMTQDEHSKLESILEKHKLLFDGKLGLYQHERRAQFLSKKSHIRYHTQDKQSSNANFRT